MASTSPDSLSERAEQLTHQNNGSDPVPPPPVAAQSPFDEVMMRDLAAALPAALARRLEAAASVGDVYDWLAAGAIFRWLAADDYVAGRFLRAVSADPRRAGLALAEALAARLEPPPREAPWRRCNRLGLALQLTLMGLLLLCRGLLFAGLGPYGGFSLPREWSDLIRGMLGLDLLSGPGAAGLIGAVRLGCAAFWLALEAIAAPRLMEGLRRLPARLQRLPPPLAWRTEAFYLLWYGQAALLLLGVCGRYWLTVVPGTPPGGQRAAVAAIALLVTAVIWPLLASARATAQLGTTTGRHSS